MMHQPPQDLHGYRHNCVQQRQKWRRSSTLKKGTVSVPETLEHLYFDAAACPRFYHTSDVGCAQALPHCNQNVGCQPKIKRQSRMAITNVNCWSWWWQSCSKVYVREGGVSMTQTHGHDSDILTLLRNKESQKIRFCREQMFNYFG